MPETFPSPAVKMLTVAALFVVSLIATVFGFTSAEATRQKIAAFASDSVVATGVVTNWDITNVARSPEYWLDLTLKAQDGSARKISVNVDKPLFDSHPIGSSVPVTYVRSRPEWFYAGNDVPTDRQAVALDWLFRLGALASVLSAIGLFAMVFNTPGDGTPSRGASVIPLSTGATTAPRPMGPARAGFGRRGR